jgi:hypothetical protein
LIATVLAAGPECSQAADHKAEITVTADLVGVNMQWGSAWRNHRKLTYLLTGAHAIQATTAVSGFDLKQSVGNLGGSVDSTSVTGLKIIQSFSVIAGALVITNVYPTYVSKLTVKTDGKTSCSASLEFLLKGGNTFFDLGDGLDSDVHSENVSCSIQAVEN